MTDDRDPRGRPPERDRPTVAFVLGGGGVHGAVEVGMIRALDDAGVRPDLVVGTSVGAINGAAVAADPSGAAEHLGRLWRGIAEDNPFSGSLVTRVSTLVRTRTYLHDNGPLRALLRAELPVDRIEDLPVPFACVAASVERAAARWFDEGPLVEAILASCAVPGLLPPVVVDGEHHLDGGLVHSIPLGRAIAHGATEIYVLQVGRVETPLRAPANALEAALVAFEIARRHRYVEELAAVPPAVTVHVLPSGSAEDLRFDDLSQFRYRDVGRVEARIQAAYDASSTYLTLAG